MTSTVTGPDQLLRMTQEEIDELFRSVDDPGPIPAGSADGTVIVARGSEVSETAAKVAHLIAWQGKVFDPEKGQLLNKVGPLGEHAVRADVYRGDSWFDGNPAIILDYSRTSLVAHWVRDEIRQVAPGLYLGIVYWEKDRILNFCLRFPHR
jgi:hypothetical protein